MNDCKLQENRDQTELGLAWEASFAVHGYVKVSQDQDQAGLLYWPCFWNGSCFFRLCRHYEKEAKDKRICAAHQATVFYFHSLGIFYFLFFIFFGGYCFAFWAFLTSWAQNKLCDRCDNNSSRSRTQRTSATKDAFSTESCEWGTLRKLKKII